MARQDSHRFAGTESIDALLKDQHLDVLVAPTDGPAWLIGAAKKDQYVGIDPGQPAAMAGYPHLTVPMGEVRGLPVGLSFIGTAWSDGRLVGYGYAYEQAAQVAKFPALALQCQ